jgi:hypothetical protein
MLKIVIFLGVVLGLGYFVYLHWLAGARSRELETLRDELSMLKIENAVLKEQLSKTQKT